DVGIGHQDQLAVAQLARIEVVLADPASQRRDHGANLFVPQHLVVPGLLDVENLSLQRKDRLELTVAALLGRPACRLSLDKVEFAAIRLPLGAIGKLTRQSAAIKRALAPGQVPSLT